MERTAIVCALVFMLFTTTSFAQNYPAVQLSETKEGYPADWTDIVKNNIGKFTSYRKSYIGYSLYNDDSYDKGELKFQFSLKYQLIGLPNIKKLVCTPDDKNQCIPETVELVRIPDESSRKWYNNFYFGYTQKSIWSVQKFSMPFKENNYAPELFYIYQNDKRDKVLDYVIFGIIRHESTGEAGAGSHGWNINYIEPSFKLGEDVAVSTKVWIPAFFLPKDKVFEDANMLDFYGYGELSAKWRFWRSSQLSTTFRHGMRRGKYGLESQLDVDLNSFGFKSDYINPAFFVQVWKGYGETLKTFDKNTTNVIIGISAIR